jgi:hypothetical protein
MGGTMSKSAIPDAIVVRERWWKDATTGNVYCKTDSLDKNGITWTELDPRLTPYKEVPFVTMEDGTQPGQPVTTISWQ